MCSRSLFARSLIAFFNMVASFRKGANIAAPSGASFQGLGSQSRLVINRSCYCFLGFGDLNVIRIHLPNVVAAINVVGFHSQ